MKLVRTTARANKSNPRLTDHWYMVIDENGQKTETFYVLTLPMEIVGPLQQIELDGPVNPQ